MHIALVEPWHTKGMFREDHCQPPTQGLLRLAAMTPGQAVVWDGTVFGEEATLEFVQGGFDFVGVTAQTPHRHEALQVLRVAKQSGATTVVGGCHASAQPTFFDHEYVDYIVRGEGEVWWDALMKGSKVPRITSFARNVDLNEYPFADWSSLKPDAFSYNNKWNGERGTVFLIADSYGCTGRCIYCMSRMMHGKPRTRAVDSVMQEIRCLYDQGARTFWPIGECFGFEPEWAIALCNELAELDIQWYAFGRPNLMTEELLDAMAASGCIALVIGFESASQEMLLRLGKGDVDVTRYDDIIEWCSERNIYVSPQIMHGLPYETEDHEPLTEAFLERNRIEECTLGETWVMPGMPLYKQCKKAGLIDDTFWDGPDPYYVYDGGLEWPTT